MKRDILRKIDELWNLVPDMRFGQLMQNFIITNERDCFYLDDEKMFVEICRIIKNIREKQEDRKIAKLLEDEITREQVLELLRDSGLI